MRVWIGLLLATAAITASAASGPPLEKQVGAMLVVGFRGTDPAPDSPIMRAVRQGYVGGVILFRKDVPTGRTGRNIASPDQLRRLTRRLQDAAPRRLLIAVDQEGGQVSRLTPQAGFPERPSATTLADQGSAATAATARRTAGLLAELGINWNLAPVVDLARNPDNPVIAGLNRSFGAGAGTVARHATAWIRAHHEAGVATAIKHFPGHGSSEGDTHSGPVDITDTWHPVELTPYRRLIHRGLADAVMIGHLRHKRLDPDWPATLSRRVISGVLRDYLGFQGAVVTDDLQMRALRERYTLRTRIRRAVVAGADLLIFANNTVYQPRIAERAAGILADLVRDGTIPRSRIHRSRERIQQLIGPLEEGKP